MNFNCGLHVRHCVTLVSVLAFQAFFTSPASAACMVQSPTAQTGAPVPRLTILVPKREIAQYEALGFTLTDCGAKTQSRQQYRDAICKLAKASDGEAGSGLLAVPPKQLCKSAQAAIEEGE